ncbi:MAG: choice-of-anchor C family protein [Alphaproteobacteria bacterium]|nr:choice-of-anchor C family protein [Alphaproteobacteria bacterium]
MRISALVATAGLLFASATAANAAAFTNGDFEKGIDLPPGGFATVMGGDSSSIKGWTVIGNSVDYVDGYWQAGSGERSIDLNGMGAGGLSQTFDVVTGTEYMVRFLMSGNPDGADTQFLKASVNSGANSSIAVFAWPSSAANTRADMDWTEVFFTFTAGSSSATLTFESFFTSGFFGAAIDNVSVVAVPLPMALPLFGAGLAALGLVSRRRKQAA